MRVPSVTRPRGRDATRSPPPPGPGGAPVAGRVALGLRIDTRVTPRRRIAMRMGRTRFLALAVAALVLALAGPARADNTQGITDTTIRIGNIGPYTGDASSYSALNFGPTAYFR